MQHPHHQHPCLTSGGNDYHVLPATPKQIAYARQLAHRSGADLPDDALSDRRVISKWIDSHKAPVTQFSNYPSSKQVAFAERIARIKRRDVPHGCFKDRTMMSKWIDNNL